MVYNGVNRKGIYRLWCNKRNNICNNNNNNNSNTAVVTTCVGETNDKTIFHEAEGDCRVRLVIMSTRRRSDARRFLSVAPNKLKESALLNTTCWLLLE